MFSLPNDEKNNGINVMLQVWNHLGYHAHYFLSFTLPILSVPKIPHFPVKVPSFIRRMMKREKLSTYEYFNVAWL